MVVFVVCTVPLVVSLFVCGEVAWSVDTSDLGRMFVGPLCVVVPGSCGRFVVVHGSVCSCLPLARGVVVGCNIVGVWHVCFQPECL